jgi:hypothetical protein
MNTPRTLRFSTSYSDWKTVITPRVEHATWPALGWADPTTRQRRNGRHNAADDVELGVVDCRQQWQLQL